MNGLLGVDHLVRGLLSQPQRAGARTQSRNTLGINHPLSESSAAARIPISMLPFVGGGASGYTQEDLATLQLPEETTLFSPLGFNITDKDLARFGLATDALDWVPGAAVLGGLATGAGLLGRALKGNRVAPESDEMMSAMLGPAMQRQGLLDDAMVGGDAGRPTLEEYTRSQRPSKKIKYGSPAQALRKEIKAKRDARRDLAYSNQDNLGRFGIDLRLQRHQARKQRDLAAQETEKTIESAGGLWNARFSNEIRKASNYSRGGWEVREAITRANMEAVPRQLKKLGWKMRHSSAGRGGRKSSRYILSPDNKYEVRLSDHYLPDTPQRADTIARGGHSWTDEIVLDGYESPQALIDAIQRAARSDGDWGAADVLQGLDDMGNNSSVDEFVGKLLDDGLPMDEASSNLAEIAAAIKKRHGLADLNLAQTARGDIELSLIKRGDTSGSGKEAMADITALADSQGKNIVLSADPTMGGRKGTAANKKRLTDYYKRFGFVENKGRNKDFAFGGPTQGTVMYRRPQSSQPNALAELPMDEASRMQRARDMGFDTGTTLYHGTPDARGIHEDGFSVLTAKGREPGPTFFSDDYKTAASYADDSRAWDYQNAEPETIKAFIKQENPLVVDAAGETFRGIDPDKFLSGVSPGPRKENMERIVRTVVEGTGGRLITDDAVSIAKQFDYDGLVIRNVVDDYAAKGKPSNIMVTFNPNQIRSPAAAFDPAKRNSANLLATAAPIVATGLLGANALRGLYEPDALKDDEAMRRARDI